MQMRRPLFAPGSKIRRFWVILLKNCCNARERMVYCSYRIYYLRQLI